MVKCIALADLASFTRSKIIYTPKGAKLTIISDCDSVLIFEYNGNRFPVHKSKIEIDENHEK